MPEKIREFQIFAKPVGSLCNLACSYCYYLDKAVLYPQSSAFRMTGDILELYISQHIEATPGDTILFSWHGGEPTLAGIDFYEKAVTLQRRYLPSGRRLINGIQTNGILLNNEWCRFFARENFIVGISIDGTEELHDLHRKDKRGKGTFKQVLKGYNLLQQYGITSEILCVVNSRNVNYPLDVYHFFKQLDARYITFLPLVERHPDSSSGVTPSSVPAKAFGRFLITIFDEWMGKDIGKIDIQVFEEAIRTAFNRDHTLCIFKKNCGGVPVVEHNGDFYSCDHYVDPDHYLGNIRDNSITSFLDSPAQRKFGLAKSDTLPRYCQGCDVKVMCNGECPKNRFIEAPDGEPGLNYLCAGYKMFFSHCRPFIEALRQVSKE